MASNAKALSFLSGDLSLSETEVSINVAGSVQSDSITGSTITMKNTGSTIVASDGTTAVLSESSGTVTIDVDVSTIGSATISGGSITGTEIDLKSSGTTIFASDGTTAVLSESGGTVTLTADEANVGSNALVVDSSGNVGIGVSPAERLSIRNSTGNGTLDIKTGTVTADSVRIQSGGSVTNYLEYRGYLGHVWFNDTTERMRIDSSGRVLVTPSTTVSGYGIRTTGERYYSRYALELEDTDQYTQYAGLLVKFKRNGSDVGTIQTTGSSTAYNTSSDYRLKENITEITDGISRVKQLNPSRFNFIVDPDRTVDGFIAHEVQGIVPEAITGEKDAVNEDGSINPQGIDQSKLVPLLTAALQESIALIESQQSQIDTLTTKTQEQDFTIASLISRIEALENP